MDSLRTCDPSWQVVPSANVGSLDNYLTAVTALAPTDVWAVGYYTGTGRYLSLTEHWDGAQWSIVPSPNPGAYNNVLRGVTAISAGDAWAVGDYNNSYDHPTRHLLTLHWDGVQWNVVPNPDPGGNYDNSINSVKAFASDDVWAVGFYRYTSFHDLRMFWNGVQWTVSDTPTVPYGNSASVDGLGAADVWAVGRNGLVYPNQPLLEHWDGSTWQEASGPALPDDSWMNGVGVISADDVWAVGTYAPNNVRHSLVEQWDGSTWGVIPSPDVGELKGITAISSSDAWAVAAGTFLHWDGSAWTATGDPAGGSLTAIDSLYSTDIWAVGTQQLGGVNRTLVEHYASSCSTPLPSPTPTSTPPAVPPQPPPPPPPSQQQPQRPRRLLPLLRCSCRAARPPYPQQPLFPPLLLRPLNFQPLRPCPSPRPLLYPRPRLPPALSLSTMSHPAAPSFHLCAASPAWAWCRATLTARIGPTTRLRVGRPPRS